MVITSKLKDAIAFVQLFIEAVRGGARPVAAFKEAVSLLGVSLSTLGKVAIAAAAIFALVKILDTLIVTTEEAREKLANLKDEFNEIESELETTKSELETINDRIDELLGKDKLTFTEEEELANLQAQRRELERIAALQNFEANAKQKEVNEAFVESMDKDLANAKEYYTGYKFASENYSPENTSVSSAGHGTSVRTMSEKDLLNSALMRRTEIIEELSGELTAKEREELENFLAEIDEYLIGKSGEFSEVAEGISYIDNPTTEDEQKVNEWLDFINDFNDKMMIAFGEDNAKTNAFNRLVDNGFSEVTADLKELGEQGEVTASHLADPKYDAFIQKCIELGIITASDEESLGFLALAFNSLGESAGNASAEVEGTGDVTEEALASINEGIDDTQSRLSSLSDALEKLRDGSLGVGDVIDLLQQFPELAPYVDLTAESFGDLEQGLLDLIHASPNDLIETLQEFKATKDLTEEQAAQIDNLCEALRDMPTNAIKDVTGEFGVLAEQIRAATTAQTELEKKLAEDDYDAGYEGRVEAFEGFQDVVDAGEYGSKAYAAYKDYFIRDDLGLDSSGVKDWMEQNEKYFTDGTDGVLEFLKAVEKLGESDESFKNIATFDSDTGAFWYDINKLSDFAEELGWTEEMLQDFIYKYRMYCEEWESRSAQDNLTEFTNEGLLFGLGDDTFASLEELMKYTGLSRDEVKGLISDINDLNNTDITTKLEQLGDGGNVDLTLRPAIDTSELINKGWDVAAGEIATVFTNTFTNEAGNIAVNFTPIIVDENGNYVGTLSEEELITYAEGVIAGTREDDLNLQIGSEFVGDDAIQKAEEAADRIHELHQSLQEREGIQLIGEDQITITQAHITQWQNLGATAEEVSELLINLKEQDVAIAPNLYIDTESGPQIDVDKMLAEAGFEDSQTVQLEVDLVVNNEPAMATVEFTVGEVEQILGEDWEAKLTANSVDAETGISTVDQLLSELPPSTDVLLLDNTGLARSSLSTVINLLDTVEDNKTKTVTIRYRTIGIPMFADGTRRAQRGPALLGDEYSPDGSPKPELVVSGNTAYIAGADGPEIGFLNDGDVVYTADQTKRILKGNVLHKSIPAHAGGTPPDWAGLSGGAYSSSGSGNKGSSSSSSSSTKSGDEEESWFERQYKDHQHWLAMDQESVADYLAWLDSAYKKAYNEGVIDIDEYYSYQEEVYQGIQDLFKDHLNDIDHEISMLEGAVGSSDEVIALAEQAMRDIEKELAAARAAGLDENSEYIQYLEQQWKGYSETVTDLREQAETDAKNSVDELVDYRVKMLKQEIQDQKDALNEKLDDLGEFYDKQRQMLQDQYDEEKYLEEQKEKRKSVTDIQAELAALEFDDSAWAQKRKLELQADLADAQKDLSDFEKDHALENTLDLLEEQQAAQEAQIQAEMDALDEKLNDPEALFNQALNDIKNNTEELYQEFLEYNRKHGTGNDEDVEEMWEEAYKADQEYKDTHDGESQDGIEIGNYTGYVAPEPETPPQPDTSTTTPPAENNTTTTEPETPAAPKLTSEIKKKVAAAIWNGGYGWGNGSTRANRLTEVFGAGNGIQDLVNKGVGKTGVSLTSEYTYTNMRKKFKGYASGTDNATPGWHELFEGDVDEYIFTSGDGSRYRMFSGLGDKVLNGDATDFLYDFANSGGTVLTKMLADLLGQHNFGNAAKPVQAIQLSSGDIIIQGNADRKTVSEIRRAQRESLEFVIKEFNKLNK